MFTDFTGGGPRGVVFEKETSNCHLCVLMFIYSIC